MKLEHIVITLELVNNFVACGVSYWVAYANTNVPGGAVNSATTVDACKAACVSAANCSGIDWAANNAASSQCYLIWTTNTAPRNNGTALGVTHHDYLGSGSCTRKCNQYGFQFSSSDSVSEPFGEHGKGSIRMEIYCFAIICCKLFVSLHSKRRFAAKFDKLIWHPPESVSWSELIIGSKTSSLRYGCEVCTAYQQVYSSDDQI